MKIEQMSFNGKRICAEGRTGSDVGDRIEAFVTNARSSDVDPVFRNEFFVTSQVNRRHSIFRSVPASTPGGTQNAEGTRQQISRPAHAAFGNELSDVTA